MTTKFNIGDEVLIKGEITGIHVFLDGKIYYDVGTDHDILVSDETGYFEESHLLSAEEYGDRTVPASD